MVIPSRKPESRENRADRLREERQERVRTPQNAEASRRYWARREAAERSGQAR